MVKIARALGTEETSGGSLLLGETAAQVEIVRNSILAAEAEAKVDPENGMIYPDFTALLVPRVMGPRIYGDFVHRLRRISGSTLMQAPASLSDFDGEAGPFMHRYLAGTGASAREKIELARLAWDICGTEFGSRHVLYELFYAGDPDAIMAGMHKGYAHKNAHLAMFDRFVKT
jgi:4-hydroxyphenylacetate 3-monooxygenase